MTEFPWPERQEEKRLAACSNELKAYAYLMLHVKTIAVVCILYGQSAVLAQRQFNHKALCRSVTVDTFDCIRLML